MTPLHPAVRLTPLRRRSLVLAAACALGSLALHAQTPAPGADRAAMVAVQVPSHGALMNGIVYVAAGAEAHPAVILLHGFPGNEQNLDLAQDIRRAGWDVLFFHYRGSWGSPGDYSFSHGIEDTAAAIAFVRDPAEAKKLRLDPTRIVLIGHSVGGFNAVEAGAADPKIAAIGIISAADMGGRVPPHIPKLMEGMARKKVADALASQGMAPLAGVTPDSLAQDVLDHAAEWRFDTKAAALATRPFLAITADDGSAPSNNGLADAMRKAGDTAVTMEHYATDHSYSDKRQELSGTVIKWLNSLPVASASTVPKQGAQ